jgi:hypothetical protein
MPVKNSDLKNIVDGWFNTNSENLLKGFEMRTAKDLLNYERKVLLVLMQLGALIMTWILKTRLQDIKISTSRNMPKEISCPEKIDNIAILTIWIQK